MARGFLQQIYMANPEVCPQELLMLVEPKISEEMNSNLCKAVFRQEIGDALFQIGPLKASGPDVFPARFFQKNWGVLKNDIV
jgi:hypothetical protein